LTARLFVRPGKARSGEWNDPAYEKGVVFNPFLPDWSPVLRKTPPQVQNLAATQFVLPSVQFVLTPAVLCIPDCAKFLGVTPNFIETEMRAGRLAFLFYGGKRVVRISELQRWLDEQEEKSGKLACNVSAISGD
jgi:hypothetical protein